MEILIISLIFFTIALVGCMLALLLIVRAVRRDNRDEAAAEPQSASGSQPAWVGPPELSARQSASSA